MIHRHQGLDAARAFACLMVVLIHTAAPSVDAGPTSPGWFAANILHGASRWSVPVFFMLTGWAYLTEKGGPQPKAFVRLLSALTFYSFIAIIFTWENTGVLSGFDFLWKGPVFYHLWYFYVALAVYAILTIVRLKNDTPRWILWMLVVGPVLANPHFTYPITGSPTGNPFHINQGFGLYLLYALSAGSLAYLKNWSTKKGVLIGGALFTMGVFWTVFATHLISVKADRFVSVFYEYGSIGPMLAAYGVFIAGLSLPLLPKLLSSVASFLSNRSLAVYGLHPFILVTLDALYPLRNMVGLHIVGAFVFTIVLSLLAAELLSRFDKGKWVS